MKFIAPLLILGISFLVKADIADIDVTLNNKINGTKVNEFVKSPSLKLDNQAILNEIKDEFLFIWNNYRKIGFNNDEIAPVSGKGKVNTFGGWSVTLVDSLSTLYVLGLTSEFNEAVNFVKTIDYKKGKSTTSFFEITIRHLAGLISAYDLSGNKVLLDKAVELADVLMIDFDSPSGMPYVNFDFINKQPVRSAYASLANIGTCQLEFTRLSLITGNQKYRTAALKVYDKIDEAKSGPGLYYADMDVNTGKFTSKQLTFSAIGDSFFEYLIKLYIMLGPKDTTRNKYQRMYSDSMGPLVNTLVKPCGNLKCLGHTDRNGNYLYDQHHLANFISGNLLLADKFVPGKNLRQLGLDLLETFSAIPASTATGLAPESVKFDSKGMYFADVSNVLRPEFAESLFYAYRYTQDTKYQTRAYNLFKAFKTYSKAPYGYAEYGDVNQKSNQQRDTMASFFLAETMKYLYLTFTPNTFYSLEDWVFNTEAHPFKISK